METLGHLFPGGESVREFCLEPHLRGGALAVRCGRGLWPRRMPPRGGASFAQPALRLELLFLLSHICGIVAALCHLLVPLSFHGVCVLWFVYHGGPYGVAG